MFLQGNSPPPLLSPFLQSGFILFQSLEETVIRPFKGWSPLMTCDWTPPFGRAAGQLAKLCSGRSHANLSRAAECDQPHSRVSGETRGGIM